MKCNRSVLSWVLLTGFLTPAFPSFSQSTEHESSQASKEDNDKPVDGARLQHPMLWHDPGRIADLNLYYGQGGKDAAPVPPFKFESEDTSGTNPKFNVKDGTERSGA